jgi:hypothetical protein
MEFDGYTIVREVHASSRSHIYLAIDGESGARVIIKIPSIDLGGDAAYLESFLMEEWIARRIDSAHVLKAAPQTRKRNYIYVVTEFIEGRTLAQWMIDDPAPDLETVRGILEQTAKGLQAFHRLEMLHQDLRPENIMIDGAGTVKLIDFGSTRVAGIDESASRSERRQMAGTLQYAAPEYFLWEEGSTRSDQYSLGGDRLSNAERTLSLRHRCRQMPDPGRTEQAEVRLAHGVAPRRAGLGRRCDQEGRAPEPRKALRGDLRAGARPAPSEPGVPVRPPAAAHRAQSAGVLEAVIADPVRAGGGSARDPPDRRRLRPAAARAGFSRCSSSSASSCRQSGRPA